LLSDSQLYTAIGSIGAFRKTIRTNTQVRSLQQGKREAGFILYIALLTLSSIVPFENMLYLH